MNEQQAVAKFSALSQETRLSIVRYLVSAEPEGAPAGVIATSVGVSASALSFHLTTLVHAGLISSKRQSRQIVYRVSVDALGDLISFLLDDCCQLNPELLSNCGLSLKTPCC